MKKDRGITLIALVVTIIILLILAGVTINFMTNNEGIFNKAKTAVDSYKNAQEEEQMILSNLVNQLDINSYRTSDLDNKEPEFVGFYMTENATKLSQDINLTLPNVESGNYIMVAFRTGGWITTESGVSTCTAYGGGYDISAITGGTIEKLGEATYKLKVANKSDISITIGADRSHTAADRVYSFLQVYLMKY